MKPLELGVALIAICMTGLLWATLKDQDQMLEDCGKKYDVHECELVAIPKGSDWLLPPPAKEGE